MDKAMREAVSSCAKRAGRLGAPKPTRIPSGYRRTYASDEGLQ